MTAEEIADTLTQLFSATAVRAIAPGSWQVETPAFRLLVLLSENESWLRVLLPIVPAEQAEPFFQQLLQANFDETQEVRYALHEGVVWGVFQHSRESLTSTDFASGISRLVSLYQAGLSDVFSQLIETRIRQIIVIAKQQGQSLETTMQSLERFYAEGLMGEIDQPAGDREQVLTAWRGQLERLWSEVE
jgi:hypothetical protein